MRMPVSRPLNSTRQAEFLAATDFRHKFRACVGYSGWALFEGYFAFVCMLILKRTHHFKM
jgi:hypothetical protein